MTYFRNNKKKFLISFLTPFFFLFVITYMVPIRADAVTFPYYAYGGRSYGNIICCNGCTRVSVGPPKPAFVMVCPWISSVFLWYILFPPAWQLGVASLVYVPCGVGSKCTDVGGGLATLIVGTSME